MVDIKQITREKGEGIRKEKEKVTKRGGKKKKIEDNDDHQHESHQHQVEEGGGENEGDRGGTRRGRIENRENEKKETGYE